MVYRRLVRSPKDSLVRRPYDADFALRHFLLPVPASVVDTQHGRDICHDLQRLIRILMGPYPLVVPTGDSAPQHSCKGCQSEYRNQLGL
jgi:hypothetical protein